MRESAKRGYTSEAELQEWLLRLQAALEPELPPDERPRDVALAMLFERDVYHSGVQPHEHGAEFAARYTISRDLEPALRAELDRFRFFVPRWNKAAAIQQALQCFSSWVRSGSSKTSLRTVSKEIRELVLQVKYEQRCAAIDQGYKLSAAVAHVVAMRSGAIAGIWHDGGEEVEASELGYGGRPEHRARSGKIFLVRDSWAMKEGLIKRGSAQYMDEVEQPAFLPLCLCLYEYITSPRSLPADLLTVKGKK